MTAKPYIILFEFPQISNLYIIIGVTLVLSGQSDRMRAKEIHLVQRKPDPQNKPGRNESYSLNFSDFLFYNELLKKKKGYLWITHIWNYTLLLDLMTKLYNADITCLECGNKIWQHFGFFNMFCGSDKKTRE